MGHGEAILADIIANPEDDTPRLVYADWLAENGDEARGEFIRVQCALAMKRLPAGATPRRELKKREKALLTAHVKGWAAEYGKWCGTDEENWKRGFPVEVRIFNTPYIDAPVIGRYLKEIPLACASAPIRGLALSLPESVEGATALAALPELGRLRRLEVWGIHQREYAGMDVERAVALALVSSGGLGGLEELRLRQMAGGRPLMEAVLLHHRLRSLDIYMAGMDDAEASRLAGSPLAGQLDRLCLGADFTAEAARVVAREPAFAGLFVLDFDNSSIGDDGAVALAGSRHLAGLRELRLNRCEIGDRGFVALARSPHLSGLRELVLCQNEGVGMPGMRALCRSTTLPRTLRLDLWRTYENPDLHRALRERFPRVSFTR